MELIVNSILNLLAEHRYIFAFLGALSEGAYIMILAGVLLKFGYFKFWGLAGILSLGYFINGVFFYLIGRLGGHQVLDKWGKKLNVTRKLIEKLEKYFQKHSIKTLFITRITWGLSILTLIIVGSFKMKLKKFIPTTIIASFVWVFITLGLGYVFGVSYKAFATIAKEIATGFAVFLFVIIIGFSIFIVYWVREKTKAKFVKKLNNNRFGFFKKIGNLINNFKEHENNKGDEN